LVTLLKIEKVCKRLRKFGKKWEIFKSFEKI